MISPTSLSNDTVKGRIDELPQDIKDQLFDQIKRFLFFPMQWDETTNIGNCSQLLLFACFLSVKRSKKKMLFYHPMKSRAILPAILNVVSSFLQENQLSEELLAEVCTNVATAMLGLQSNFIQRQKKEILL